MSLNAKRRAEERRLISICVPVFNEAGNVARLLARLKQLAHENPRYDFEFLFTDNASTDHSFELLAEAALSDRRIRVLRFSRNFGFQRSILANFLNARGDAAVQIDADLQDPPELITEFLAKWEQGYRVVFGIRRQRQENVVLSGLRRLFYRLIDYVSDVPLPHDAGDFRLIDRVIIEQLRQYEDRAPYLRGMIASIGYPQIGIPYNRDRRIAEQSKFSLLKLTALAFDGICSQSIRPLQFITFFGALVSITSALFACFYVGWALFFAQQAPAGFVTLVILILMSTGLNAAFLGIIGEYIGRIYNNSRGEPIAIIEHRIDSVSDPSPQGEACTPVRLCEP
jgi:dolichol-phosphate mannosyltransferase